MAHGMRKQKHWINQPCITLFTSKKPQINFVLIQPAENINHHPYTMLPVYSLQFIDPLNTYII